MRVDTVNPLVLADRDIAEWRSLLAADPHFSSPYLTPDWAQFVARRRPDARVAIFRNADGSAAGFLPVQRSSSYAALPAGGPVCGYQAMIGPAGLDLPLAVKALDVGRIDFTAGLRDSALAPHLLASDAGHVVCFPDGWQAWAEERQAAGSKAMLAARKRFLKLVRDHDKGAVAFEAFSTDAHAFDEMILWKREQIWRAGVTDIFERAWINTLVRDTFAASASDIHFGGALFVLRVNRRPAAALFCLRARKALHAWFISHDARYTEYSPGVILISEAIRAAAERGYTELDLGPGESRFKEGFANASRPVGAGFIGRPGLASATRAAEFQVRALVEMLPVGGLRHWPAKAMRRLDLARGLRAAIDPDREAA
jgi:CelD/BcsL family acetyltransferase involved in cellulose biosynthesis